MTNTNIKIRSLAQEIFTDICFLMRCKFNAVNQLFTIILVGLAGNNASTQSSTIRSLIFAIKQNIILNEEQFNRSQNKPDQEDMDVDDDEEQADQNKILATDGGFQQFMMKATRIVTIFLKDRRIPHELARSVL